MDIKEKNKQFLQIIDINPNLKEKRDELVKGQHPDTLVITCSDSRVIPEFIFDASLGDIFVIRTAGNVINEGELATIEYTIEHLKVKHIVVLGHTHCGAIHASIHNEKCRYLDPILNRIKLNIGNTCDELEASRINAIKEVEFIKEKFPDYKGVVEAKLYDVETSRVY